MNVKNFILMLLYSMLLGTHLFCQSPIWVVGNQYLNQQVPTALPYGPNSIDYQGQQAQYAANAWHNPVDGSLMFFIVDGIVYDGDGYRINEMIFPNQNVNDSRRLTGISEVSIIPDPSNCFRYYIIGDAIKLSFINDDLASPQDLLLHYAILDFNLLRSNNRRGDLVQFGNGANIANLHALIPSNEIPITNQSIGTSRIAITPKTPQNEHFIFYQTTFDFVYAFKLSSMGVSYIVGSSFNATGTNLVFPFNQPKYSRSELEVYFLEDQKIRLIGKSNNLYLGQDGSTITANGADRIFRMDFTTSAIPISNSF